MKKIFYFVLAINFCITGIAVSQPFVNLIWEKISDVETMSFTPNGQYLITGGSANICYPYTCGQIKLWRVGDSNLLRTITNFNVGLTNDIAMYNDNNKFITAHGSVYCDTAGGCSVDKAGQFKWSFSDSTELNSQNSQDGIIQSVDISPDQSLIAAATSFNFTGEIRIYDPSYNLLRTLPGHVGGTNSLRFTPDGQFLVSGGHDGYVKIWNVSSGALVRSLFHGTFTNGGWDIEVDISRDGRFIASAGQGYNMTVKIWNFSNGLLLHSLDIGNSDGYDRISFSPNGIYLASGLTQYGKGDLGLYGLLKFWRVLDGELVEEYIDTTGSPKSGGVRSLAFSNTGNHYFAYGISNRLRLAATEISLVTITNVNPVSGNFPDKYNLYQNYPNPFNPQTKIKFDVPSGTTGNIRITIYDGVGRELSTLLNEPLAGGEFEVTFNGAQFPSGIYYYKIQSNQFSQVKKMMLIK